MLSPRYRRYLCATRTRGRSYRPRFCVCATRFGERVFADRTEREREDDMESEAARNDIRTHGKVNAWHARDTVGHMVAFWQSRTEY